MRKFVAVIVLSGAFGLLLAAQPWAPDGGIDAALAAGPGVTGTWTGELTIGGTSRKFTLQLHERAAGEVMGYVAGGTNFRTVTGGQISGDNLSLAVELADPILTRTFAIAAVVGPTTLTGTADNGGGPQPIAWSRVNKPLHERRFLFAIPSGGEPLGLTELSVVLDNPGNLVSGGFVGVDDCDLFACGGGVTSFSEVGDTITIGLESGGGCAMTGTLTATFDGTTKFYSGDYSVDHCGMVTNGFLIGAKNTRTRTDHASKVLATFGQLADDLEAEIAFSAPYAPFHPDYMHMGELLSDRLAELNAQVAGYNAIEVDFSRFRNIATVAEPDILPDLKQPFGVDFHDRRTGEPDGGGPVEVFRDVDTRSGADELKYLTKKGNKWVIYGNQIIHDLPFSGYTLAADHVVLPTAGGDIYMSIGPWGAHVGPHTGHSEGNAKADWMGQYAWSLDQLTVLAGDDGDGICETGETCGLSAADLEARIVDYTAPADNFEITDVRLESLAPPGFYYGTQEHWTIRASVGPYLYGFVHIREISSELRDLMMAAGYTDPWTVHAPSDNLVTGDAIVLNKGDPIASPQTVAAELPGHPGYYGGGGPIPESPWQQIEFFTYNGAAGREESFYTWLPTALEVQLADMLEASGLNPGVFRYNQPFLTESRWKAEMALSNVDWMDREDYSSLFSALGGWWENPGGGGCPVPAFCDELFSIYPIAKDTAFYDPGLYHTPDVAYLTISRDNLGIERFGEVISPVEPDPVSGSMVIRWEDFGGGFYGFQGISYRLNPADRRLKIAWGPVEALEGAVIPPLVPLDADPCDGVTTTCHNHDRFGPP